MEEKLNKYYLRGHIENGPAWTNQAAVYMADHVDEREKEYKAEIGRLKKASFYLAEVERADKAETEAKGWKAQIKAADSILETYDFGKSGLLHDRVFRVTSYLEEEIERLKEALDGEQRHALRERKMAVEAEAKLKKAIHELWRHQNNAQTNKVLADIEKPDESLFTAPLKGGDERYTVTEEEGLYKPYPTEDEPDDKDIHTSPQVWSNKATLEFDLSDTEGRERFTVASQAEDLWKALHDISTHLRSLHEHSDGDYANIEDMLSFFWDTLNNHTITLEEMS